MNTKCNQCNKCMYNTALYTSIVSSEELPYTCQLCCGNDVAMAPKTFHIEEFEVISSSISLVAAAC